MQKRCAGFEYHMINAKHGRMIAAAHKHTCDASGAKHSSRTSQDPTEDRNRRPETWIRLEDNAKTCRSRDEYDVKTRESEARKWSAKATSDLNQDPRLSKHRAL
jgi:hypothetical protein